MRGTTTIMSTAMMMTRPMRNMARSFQWRQGNWPPSAADPWCLPPPYVRNSKLAIFF
jgi:hypothetical protein